MTNSPEAVVLALDGGSTKTDVVLVSAEGAVLGRSRGGPSNHQLVGIDGAMEALDEAIAAAARDAGITDATHPMCPTGVYCLAGVDLPVDEERLKPAITFRGWTTDNLLRNDTLAVSRAGSSQPWGIGVVCGTGLNCAGVAPDGTSVRFPALAELSGDFAPGGSWLGIRALGLALRADDGRGAPTLLSTRVPAHFELPDAPSVLTAVYTGQLNYTRLFELARVLLDTAAEGDIPARQAADILADEVVAFATTAITRLGLTTDDAEVVLGGGIFDTADGGFHDRVAQGIHAVAPGAKLLRLSAPPVLGAALLGLDAIGAPAAAYDRLRAALALP